MRTTAQLRGAGTHRCIYTGCRSAVLCWARPWAGRRRLAKPHASAKTNRDDSSFNVSVVTKRSGKDADSLDLMSSPHRLPSRDRRRTDTVHNDVPPGCAVGARDFQATSCAAAALKFHSSSCIYIHGFCGPLSRPGSATINWWKCCPCTGASLLLHSRFSPGRRGRPLANPHFVTASLRTPMCGRPQSFLRLWSSRIWFPHRPL